METLNDFKINPELNNLLISLAIMEANSLEVRNKFELKKFGLFAIFLKPFLEILSIILDYIYFNKLREFQKANISFLLTLISLSIQKEKF